MSIKLTNIHKKFGEKIIFDDYNLDIKAGEMVAIVGNSGKGKTTLLNIIGGLEDPNLGEITINDIRNPYKSEKQKRKMYKEYIGFLFQNYALLDNMTVKENLYIAMKYVDKDDRKEKCEQALAKVGISDKKNTKVYKLSGGEQQRVALARLLVKPVNIILADEPTGALDDDNKYEVIKILNEFHKKGKTIVIVTHDKMVAESCERVIYL